MSACDIRFDESLDRTHPAKARIIAGQLTDDGHETRTGTPWHPQAIARILAAYDARAAYATARQMMGLADTDHDTGASAPF